MVRKALTRKGLPLLAAVALLTGPLVASAQALPAAPPLAGQASRTQPAVGQPAVNPDHVKVLGAALKKMHDHYASFANFTPGPQDIFDYNIGNLWLKGIDGSGTTVAVIEGWDDPNIAAFIHVRDVRYGLPDPVIQTIYPSGPLPAQCPPGMVALGSYRSCDAWQGGNNSVIDPQTGKVLVQGFTAAPGFDVASGWGTVDASTFVPALVAATRATSLARSARNKAARELSRLEHGIRLSAGSGGTTAVTSTGFLPRHPVKLAIDGAVITTLTASDKGTVRYTLNPAALGLSHGHHVLTLQGMLITTTASFRS